MLYLARRIFRHFEGGIRNRNLAAHPPATSAYTPSLISFFSNYLIIQTLFFSRDFFTVFLSFFLLHGFLFAGFFVVTSPSLLSSLWLSSSGTLRRHGMQLWLCSQRLLSLQSGGLASPRHATRCKGWDGYPRRQRIAPSRWADQGISRALVQSQSCKMENWMWKIELSCCLIFFLATTAPRA